MKTLTSPDIIQLFISDPDFLFDSNLWVMTWTHAAQNDGMLLSLVLYPGNGTSAWCRKEDTSLGNSFRGANQSSKHSRNGMSQREVHRSHITGCRVLPLYGGNGASCPLAPKQACQYLRFKSLPSVTKGAGRIFQQQYQI